MTTESDWLPINEIDGELKRYVFSLKIWQTPFITTVTPFITTITPFITTVYYNQCGSSNSCFSQNVG